MKQKNAKQERRDDGPRRRRRVRDQRYEGLLALARAGNEEAIGDLWLEYHVDFRKEGGGDE